MYALALMASAGAAAATTDLPYFHLGALDIGIPIQWFGMIVAAGVLIGAIPLRRYAEWHGVSDDHIRGILTWVMIGGFLGAHEFDMVAYNWDKLGDATIHTPSSWWFLPVGLWPSNWPLPFRMWDGISSYGGFIGGGLGYALYVWWKRLPLRLFADITLVGLLPAFSIGRIGCTVVSDHIGAIVDGDSWYAFLAMPYPSEMLGLAPGKTILAWNLGLIELLYLIPVNIVVLWLAFRPARRLPAGFITVLAAVLYAPVRFLLDFLRPEKTDPRYGGLTFAQWASILAFGAALYVASRILKKGAVAETVAPTSREAQARLRNLRQEDEVAQHKHDASAKAETERKQAALAKARAERDREVAEEEAAERRKAAAADKSNTEDDDDDEAEDAAEDAKYTETKPTGTKPVAAKPGAKPVAKPAGNKSAAKSGANKNRSKSRKR